MSLYIQRLKRNLKIAHRRMKHHEHLAQKAGDEIDLLDKKLFEETVIKKYGREFRYRGITYAIISRNRVKTVKEPLMRRWTSKGAWHLLDFLKGNSSSPFTYIPTEKALRSKIKKVEAWKKGIHKLKKMRKA